MPVTMSVLNRLSDNFENDLVRTETLFHRICLEGGTSNGIGDYTPFRQPDRRDAAQFIFFEVAAQFENFCQEAFMLEIRLEFDVQPKKAKYIMGSSDRALSGVMGWASPKVLQTRAGHLVGRRGFFARLENQLGSVNYDRLFHAHKIRNRIAHTGGKASKEFNSILGQLGVPLQSRRGLSAGRLLLDYPLNTHNNDRWLPTLLNTYRDCKNKFHSYMDGAIND